MSIKAFLVVGVVNSNNNKNDDDDVIIMNTCRGKTRAMYRTASNSNKHTKEMKSHKTRNLPFK